MEGRRLPSHVMDLGDDGGVGGLTSAISAMSVDKEQPPSPRSSSLSSRQYTDEEMQHLASLELTLVSTLSPEMQMAYDELEYEQRLQALDMLLRQHHQPPLAAAGAADKDDDDEEERLRLHRHQQPQQQQQQSQRVRMPEEHFLTIAINGKFYSDDDDDDDVDTDLILLSVYWGCCCCCCCCIILWPRVEYEGGYIHKGERRDCTHKYLKMFASQILTTHAFSYLSLSHTHTHNVSLLPRIYIICPIG